MNPLDEWKNSRLNLLNRLLVVYLLLAVWIVLLAGRLVQLQIVKSGEYQLEAEQQQIGFIEFSPKRGDILDRHLDELAISVEIDSIFTHPREVREPVLAAKSLAEILKLNEQELYKKLISDRPFAYLARKIPPRQAEQIRALNLSGVYLQREPKRLYPGRELAANVLGFVGIDNEGLSGLEYLYNDSIKGRKTKVNLLFDAKRHSYSSDAGLESSDGNTVVLNLDRPIQYIVEQVLKDVVSSTEATDGNAVVMDPHTGEILAMASYPSFNPNRYSDFAVTTHRNRAILDIYEPGSTFKLITFSGVLNEGLGNTSEPIDCRVGTLRIAGKTYREAKRSYGVLSFNEVLAKSSNVGTIKLGLRLGEEKLYNYVKLFGFGQQTGVDLPGEQQGLLRPSSQWSRISIGAISIGQEVGVTTLQMSRAVCAIANGGYLVTPRMVRRILTPDGDMIYESSPERARVLEAETTHKMKEALELVVTDGTGRGAQLGGYTSAGKTGTAQKFVDGKYSDSKYIASYAGFAPLENPVLAAVIVINEPKNQYYGGQVAAPAFKQLMERSLIHLSVPRDAESPLETTSTQHSWEDLATSDGVSVKEEELPLERLEETILTLMEKETSSPESHQKITVETNTFTLPDFSSLSLREVAHACARLGLRLKVVGSGVAVGQRPPANSQVSRETVCEVFFSNRLNHVPSKAALRSGPDTQPRVP